MARDGRGVAFVVYGKRAQLSAAQALETLRARCDVPVTVHDTPHGDLTPAQQARYAKTTLLDWTPYAHTLYMDADTRVYGDLSAGWAALDDGWDMALAFSDHQGADAMWHVGDEERAATTAACGYLPLALQGGVLFVARNTRTLALWAAWHAEWLRWQDQDQAALLRALARVPVRMWLLGRPFNGGAVVNHRFGQARA